MIIIASILFQPKFNPVSGHHVKYTLILMFDLHWLQCPLDRAVSARNEQHILQPDFLHTVGWVMIFKFHLLSMSRIIMKHCQKATTISH